MFLKTLEFNLKTLEIDLKTLEINLKTLELLPQTLEPLQWLHKTLEPVRKPLNGSAEPLKLNRSGNQGFISGGFVNHGWRKQWLVCEQKLADFVRLTKKAVINSVISLSQWFVQWLVWASDLFEKGRQWSKGTDLNSQVVGAVLLPCIHSKWKWNCEDWGPRNSGCFSKRWFGACDLFSSDLFELVLCFGWVGDS